MARHELWVELADRPGNLAALAGELAACGANIVHLDIHPGSANGAGDTVIDRLVVQVPDDRARRLGAVAEQFGATLRDLDGHHDLTSGRPSDPEPGRRPLPLPAAATPAGVARRSEQADRPEPATRRLPTTLERLVALPDGGLVRLRHLVAGDRDDLVAHHLRCSAATRRHSRFVPSAELRAATVSGGTYPDGCRDHVALAALVGGDIVGAARYGREGVGPIARMAVIVEDRHQRRGIGTLLVGELAALAAQADLHCLRAIAPDGSDALVRTLRRVGLGFTVRRVGDDTVVDCGLPDGLSATA